MIVILATMVASMISPNFSTGLRVEAERIRLNLGSCAPIGLLRENADGGKYAVTLAREMNLVEPENELKPPTLWRGIGQYDYTNPDFLKGDPGHKGLAQKNHMKVRGHVLVYARDEGYTIPGWLLKSESSISSDQAKGILRDYIHTVAGRYKGKIAMWDVVNEAVDDSPNKRPFNLRDSFWFRKLGPEFLVLAFKYAHEADPKAELYYNDYAIENGGWKGESVLQIADYLKKEGAPITGLGLQYHTVLREVLRPGDGHYKMLDEIKARKLAFMITELDLGIPVKEYPTNDPRHGLLASSADLKSQAERYGDLFRVALSYKNCHGIQMWGFTDRHSWIPGYEPGRGAALLFDGDYQPKQAYFAVEKELKKAHR